MKSIISYVSLNRNYVMLNIVFMIVFIALRYWVTQLNHGVWAQEPGHTGDSWSWLDVPALILVTPIFVSALRFLSVASASKYKYTDESLMSFPIFMVAFMFVGAVVYGGYGVVLIVIAVIGAVLAFGIAFHVCMKLLSSKDSQGST